MNNLVSRIFAAALNVIHVIVAICFTFALVSVLFFSQKSSSVFLLLGGAVGYVLFVGVVSTLIAIRENLEILIKVAKE